MKLKVKKLSFFAVMPEYKTEGAAGFDLSAAQWATLAPGETKAIPTDLSFEIPVGFELQIRPRSGMSLNTSLRVANAPGTIDSDYRGNVAVILHNTNFTEYADIEAGQRIAQAVLVPVVRAEFEEAKTLSSTERGSSGFGSTGE